MTRPSSPGRPVSPARSAPTRLGSAAGGDQRSTLARARTARLAQHISGVDVRCGRSQLVRHPARAAGAPDGQRSTAATRQYRNCASGSAMSPQPWHPGGAGHIAAVVATSSAATPSMASTSTISATRRRYSHTRSATSATPRRMTRRQPDPRRLAAAAGQTRPCKRSLPRCGHRPAAWLSQPSGGSTKTTLAVVGVAGYIEYFRSACLDRGGYIDAVAPMIYCADRHAGRPPRLWHTAAGPRRRQCGRNVYAGIHATTARSARSPTRSISRGSTRRWLHHLRLHLPAEPRLLDDLLAVPTDRDRSAAAQLALIARAAYRLRDARCPQLLFCAATRLLQS